MNMDYIIKKVQNTIEGDTINKLPWISIEHYLWETNGYTPKVEAAVCYSDTCLYVHFTAWENSIKVAGFEDNGQVWKDSCVEFFLNPMPESGSCYLNFEINAAGVLLLGMGTNRNNRRLLDNVRHEIFNIRTSVPKKSYATFNGPYWTIDYNIPFDFLKALFEGFNPVSGKEMSGNFYKCGDETEFPHYGCWSPVDKYVRDFHTPQYFGRLILE